MTFKKYQAKYINAYNKKQPVGLPKKLFSDQQEVYDTFLHQTEVAMEQIKDDKLSLKDRVDAVALIDFCTTRCMSIITNFKQLCNAVSDYNHSVEKQFEQKA